MSERPEFPELLPPDAPHAQRMMTPGWWILPGAIVGLVSWGLLFFWLV
ncbi:hypothetical protein [Cypionkella sp.]|nr:hypothetical protein [Cypionkella sp.]MDZ4393526.1 hypothetical protein [Cypionkella sp.]